MQVFFTDLTYEETKEEFVYGIVSLLCDIGGTLGLLLGASGNMGTIIPDIFYIIFLFPIIMQF